MEVDSWDAIEQESQRLGAAANFMVPRPHRTLPDIQAEAKQARSTVGLVSTTAERTAAAGLLSDTVNTAALTQRLVGFHAKGGASDDEAALDAATSVDEYLEAFTRRAIGQAMQRHLDDSAERFDAFLDHRMDAHWAAQRHALLRASMGAPGDGGRGPPGTPALLDGGGSAAGLLTPASGAVAVRASTSSPYPSAEGKAKLTEPQAALADCVRTSLQAAGAAGMPFDAMESLRTALKHVPSSDERAHGRVQDVWEVLALQRARMRGAGTAAGGQQRDLLRGSVEHLEAAYYDHVLQRVSAERVAARSGGSGSAESVLAGFVNASAAAAGADVATRAWLQVYQALRAGKPAEAAAFAEPHALAITTLQHVADSLRAWLTEWAPQRSLPEDRRATIRQHLDSALQGGELRKQSASLAHSVLVVLCVLCGSQAALVRAVKGEVPALAEGTLPSIEDYLWFHCSLASSQAGGASADAVAALQQTICQAPPEHYSRGGARPLLYASVLALTLQHRRLLLYLHRDRSAGQLRDFAAILAFALFSTGLLAAGEAGSASHGSTQGELDVRDDLASGLLAAAQVVQDYAYDAYGPAAGKGWVKDSAAYLLMLRVVVDMQHAAAAGARALGDGSESSKQAGLQKALRKWVLDTREAGSRPDEQLLRLFEPASAVRRDVLQAVARELQFDEPEMSAELFALAGRHCYALEHLNFRLSREILGLSKAAGDARRQRAVDAVRALSLRAHELKQGFEDFARTAGAEAAAAGETPALRALLDEHWRGFLELQHLGALLDADRALRAAAAARQAPEAAKVAAVLSEARHLRWLPTTAAQVPACARMHVPPYVRELLRETLLAVARALSLDAATKADPKLQDEAQQRLAHVKHFAGYLGSNLGGEFASRTFLLELNGFS